MTERVLNTREGRASTPLLRSAAAAGLLAVTAVGSATGVLGPASSALLLISSAVLLGAQLERVASRRRRPRGANGFEGAPDSGSLVERLSSELRSVELERDTILARHELITTNIAAAVIIRDVQGKVLFCSPYTQVLTGYSIDEIYESEEDFLETLVLEDDKPRYQRAQKVSALAEDISVKYRIHHRSGLIIWLETRLVPVCDENGELLSIMSVAIDVTDTLSYQNQIEEQNRDLSDFAYMVSHDLKAPIFTIKGMAAALLEDHGEAVGEQGCELITYVIEATKRLEQLVASVIEYSSIATKEVQDTAVDLNETVANASADLAELIRSRAAIIHVEPNLPTINGNGVRLYQVFSNLLGNALKYSSPDRTPEITVRQRKGVRQVVIIEVVDNGLGIPAAKLGDIFRPYHRAHGNQIEGSGIGLACVKKVMERMGGSVSVSSTEGKGSVFTVTFPSQPKAEREIPQDLMRAYEREL